MFKTLAQEALTPEVVTPRGGDPGGYIISGEHSTFSDRYVQPGFPNLGAYEWIN